MAVRAASAVSQGATFRLAPNDIKVRYSKTKLKVVIVPNPPIASQATLYAKATNKERSITYSKPLKALMKDVGWTKANFKPLESAVKAILKEGTENPASMIGVLDENLKNGLTTDFKLQYEEEYACQTPQTISLDTTPQPVSSLNFFWIPREVKVKNGDVKIELTAILSSPCITASGELIVTVEGKKTTLHYTKMLQETLAQMNWDANSLKPLENYMVDAAITSSQTPEFPVSVLNTYLTQGYAPNFTLDRSV